VEVAIHVKDDGLVPLEGLEETATKHPVLRKVNELPSQVKKDTRVGGRRLEGVEMNLPASAPVDCEDCLDPDCFALPAE
jgi:hypothetical protein